METDYTKLVPTVPPDGLIDWALQNLPRLQRELLIYRADRWCDPLTGMSEPCVSTVCTHCGAKAFVDKVSNNCACHNGMSSAPFGFLDPTTKLPIIDGRKTVCADCGCEVEVAHIGRINHLAYDVEWVMSPGKIGDKLVLTGWAVKRIFEKGGYTHAEALPYEAYVFEEDKTVRLKAWNRIYYGTSFTGEWKQSAKYQDCWREAENFYAPEDWIQGTQFENSKADLFLKCDEKPWLVSYLQLLRKRPDAENLVMQGAGRLLNELLHDYRFSGGGYSAQEGAITTSHVGDGVIDWKQSKPTKMLGLNREEYRVFSREHWDSTYLTTYRRAREEQGLGIEDAVWIQKAGANLINNLLDEKLPLLRTLRYCEKQQTFRNGDSLDQIERELKDYWEMAQLVGRDLDDFSARWPKNLRYSHDYVTEQYVNKKNAIHKIEFDKQYKRLSIYAWECDGITIRPAKSAYELKSEGKQLRHCVYSYCDKYVKGTDLIFFIRRAETPDQSWYTLDLDEKRMSIQMNLGYKNCSPTPEVKEFAAKWLQHIKAVQAETIRAERKSKKKEAAA